VSEMIFARFDDRLQPLEATPFAVEVDIQELIAAHPELLSGATQFGQVGPRRFTLVAREVAVPDRLEGSGRWSLDHLFVDQDAIPTLVEVKRAANSQLRREVVGQLLDYAANAVRFWSISDLTRSFEATHAGEASEALAGLLGEEADADEFWRQVAGNLAEGRVRLVFLADRIPTELQAIVEFLNERLEPTEVLAIELRQFRTPDGLQVLVPRVIGQTAVAKAAKRVAVSYAELLAEASASTRAMEQRLIIWAQQAGIESRPGVKARKFYTPDGVDLLNFYPAGPSLEFRLQTIRQADPEVADQLLASLSQFTDKNLTEKYPTIGTDELAHDFDRFSQDVLAPYVGARIRYSRKDRLKSG
jgi:hypothetical protein